MRAVSFRLLLVCGVAAFITGCASTQQVARFPSQNVKVSSPNMARIYVVRPSMVGGAVSFGVKDNGREIGKTGPKGYLCWERQPGKATVSGKAENTSELTFDAEKGQVYYIKQSPGMGILMARNYLTFLDDFAGRDLVFKCNPPKNVQ